MNGLRKNIGQVTTLLTILTMVIPSHGKGNKPKQPALAQAQNFQELMIHPGLYRQTPLLSTTARLVRRNILEAPGKDPKIFLELQEITSYDLATADGQADMLKNVNELLDLRKSQKELKDNPSTDPEKDLSKQRVLNKDMEVGLIALQTRLQILSQSEVRGSESKQAELIGQIAVIATSILRNFMYPVENKNFDFAYFGRTAEPIAQTPGSIASNVDENSGEIVKPENKTWLTNFSHDVEKRNLLAGYGRTDQEYNEWMTEILGSNKVGEEREPKLFEYDKPKSGYGVHAGFRAKMGKKEIKVRLGNEARAGSFGSRVMDALGFSVSRIDALKDGQFKMEYDRKFFTEFNSRSPIEVTVMGLFQYENNPQYNPFNYIYGVKMKGQTKLISSARFQKLLIAPLPKQTGENRARDRNLGALEDSDSVFNKTVENEVEYIALSSVSIEILQDNEASVGSIELDSDMLRDRRELRGLGVMGEFLGLYDIRNDNTRLMIDTSTNDVSIRLNDLGSNLGLASGLPFGFVTEDLNGMPWNSGLVSANGNKVTYKDKSYNTMATSKFLQEMNADDARWMGARLALLTREQFLDAFYASHFDVAETVLAASKLFNRRNQILATLGLMGKTVGGVKIVPFELYIVEGRTSASQHEGPIEYQHTNSEGELEPVTFKVEDAQHKIIDGKILPHLFKGLK